jgi:hypothetical protein
MLAQLNPIELWTRKLQPFELYNIERRHNDNPNTGGGELYIQVPETRVPSLLQFLRAPMPPLGAYISLQVKNPAQPNAAPEALQFWAKSQGRMRTGPVNRFRASNIRPGGWSPAAGFPTLPSGHGTAQARVLLNGLGGVRVFLARDGAGDIWAGFTQGPPTPAQAALHYANIAWAGQGGYWP